MLRMAMLVCSLLLTGCDALNCIINDHPEFSKTSLRVATLNQVFEDVIEALISNSYEDGKYNYTLKLEGELPQGISYETSGAKFTFSGTPTELGDFPIKLTVNATPRTYFDDSDREAGDLCSDSESRDMVFSVVQGG